MHVYRQGKHMARYSQSYQVVAGVYMHVCMLMILDKLMMKVGLCLACNFETIELC